MSHHPSDGARFLLERGAAVTDSTCASYRAAIYTPDACFDYTAALVMGEEPVLTPVAARADAALESKLMGLARVIARDAAKKQAEGFPPWPARILRWRGPK